MKQENKEILLKDICSRLPYRLKCSFGVDDAIYEITGINPSACGASEIQATHVKSGVNGDFKLNSCKPYLFPLSNMSEEQKREYSRRQHDIELVDELGCIVKEVGLFDSPESFEYLIENHFDYHGLIPMGLAIDATNLNIY
jgi:hypothetical protein